MCREGGFSEKALVYTNPTCALPLRSKLEAGSQHTHRQARLYDVQSAQKIIPRA
jgi:hypothetical protein